MYMLERSYVSLVGMLALTMATISFVPSKLSRKKRTIIGVLHASAHLTAALVLLMLLELGIEMCIRNQLLATSGVPFHLSVHLTAAQLLLFLFLLIYHETKCGLLARHSYGTR